MWFSRVCPGFAPDGTPILSVLAKRTYRYAKDGTVSVDDDDPLPLFEADVFRGKGQPEFDAPLQECDLVAWKPRVDVVIHGMAFAPEGKRGVFFDAIVQVGECRGAVRVFGDRKIDLSSGGLRFSDPEPFENMPLHWGLAYGGVDLHSMPGVGLAFPPNPVGKGFAVQPPPDVLHGMPLPNLEDPRFLLTPDRFLVKRFERWPQAPVPAAFGWVPRHAHPRIHQSSLPPDSSDASVRERQYVAANVPEALLGMTPKVQARHRTYEECNGAPPFLRPRRLEGGETVVLGYLDKDMARSEFVLPSDAPQMHLDLGGGLVRLPVDLQTAEIYTPTRQFTLLWRGTARYPGMEWLAAHPELRFQVEAQRG
jgi:hypothetical protein